MNERQRRRAISRIDDRRDPCVKGHGKPSGAMVGSLPTRSAECLIICTVHHAPLQAGLRGHPSDGARAGAAPAGRRPSPMNDVTRILSAIEQGDPQAAEQLLPLVYDELRKLAAQQAGPGEARPDAPGHGPGPRGLPAAGRTPTQVQHWDSRGHFFAAAAEAMRRILVENARRKRRRQARRRAAATSTSTTSSWPPTTPVGRTCWPSTRP